MTPLAHRILRELTLPKKRRVMEDRAGLLGMMNDVHCFEVSGVVKLAQDLAVKSVGFPTDETGMFLPAPKTWIEWRGAYGRSGMLACETGSPGVLRVLKADDHGGKLWSYDRGWFHPQLHDTRHLTGLREKGQYLAGLDESQEWVRAVMAIINTPRVIGRRQHMPHRGLQKKLTAAMGPQGKFPLNAWTEIVLQVTPPADMASRPSIEAHLTGQRALHFCRAHLRIRLGRLEIVSSHWRGDASLGIRQSRYRLEGPRSCGLVQ